MHKVNRNETGLASSPHTSLVLVAFVLQLFLSKSSRYFLCSTWLPFLELCWDRLVELETQQGNIALIMDFLWHLTLGFHVRIDARLHATRGLHSLDAYLTPSLFLSVFIPNFMATDRR